MPAIRWKCAVEYNRQGADELVFLDITASSDGRETMVHVVEETASKCFYAAHRGEGGSAPSDDMRRMLHAGRR